MCVHVFRSKATTQLQCGSTAQNIKEIPDRGYFYDIERVPGALLGAADGDQPQRYKARQFNRPISPLCRKYNESRLKAVNSVISMLELVVKGTPVLGMHWQLLAAEALASLDYGIMFFLPPIY